ncbi:MAG: hypothetical protein WAM43_17075 [Terriglobales bacterium]
MNLSDGVVMAVDSATTMFSGPGAISKVFMDADKLFQLGKLKVGIATYGIASLHGRTIGSFISEFTANPANADLSQLTLKEIAERLRNFFLGYYRSFLEKIHAKPFAEIPDNMKGVLGLVIGGFSPGSFQSELWEIVVPTHAAENSALLRYGTGTYGLAWFASGMPITRYLQGMDPEMAVKIKTLFDGILGRELTQEEIGKFATIIKEHEYHINYDGLPIQSGIACARFLVDFVIGHYRFAETHPIVGGKAKIGVVTYSDAAFAMRD